MIRKFNLTNGVSVVITEELAEKYELDEVHSDVAFVSILAAIVSAQDRKTLDTDGSVRLLHPYQQLMIEAAARGMLEASDEELKRRYPEFRQVTTPNMNDAEEEELKRRYFGDVNCEDDAAYFDNRDTRNGSIGLWHD